MAGALLKDLARALRTLVDAAEQAVVLLPTASHAIEEDWSGLRPVHVAEESGRLHASADQLLTWARSHEHIVAEMRRVTDDAVANESDVKHAEAARKYVASILLCLDNAPRGALREQAKEIREKLGVADAEQEIANAAAMLMGGRRLGKVDDDGDEFDDPERIEW